MTKIIALLVALFVIISTVAALKNEICGQPDSANGNGVIACAAYFPSFTYKVRTNECVNFVYGGCGGNENRFGSRQECEQKCKE